MDGSLRFYIDCFYQFIYQFQAAERKESKWDNPIIPTIPRKNEAEFNIDAIRTMHFNYSRHPPRPILAIAPDHHDETSGVNIWPHLFEGTLNGGVVLVDCHAYRRHRLWEQMVQYNYIEYDKRKAFKHQWFGDQNVLNLLLSNYMNISVNLRQYTLILPCSCNYMIPPYLTLAYKRHVCPIEQTQERIIKDMLHRRLISNDRNPLVSLTSGPISSESAHILSQFGWQQRHALAQNKNETALLIFYLAHSLGGNKMADDSLNRLRRVFVSFDGELLRTINAWNYLHRIRLNNRFRTE